MIYVGDSSQTLEPSVRKMDSFAQMAFWKLVDAETSDDDKFENDIVDDTLLMAL